MRPKAVIAARILLGLIFLAFGLNGFLHLFPVPAMEGAAATFVGGLLPVGTSSRCFLRPTSSRGQHS